MEFIQFHPTALYEPGVRGQSFLITEAVRGDGGILRNKNGEAFMERYDARRDLAPRDIVARAIDNEMKITGTEHVYLDVTHIPLEKFIEHFPNIYEKCKAAGIDITRTMIPVAPAAHYSCGGIKTDEWGRTSITHQQLELFQTLRDQDHLIGFGSFCCIPVGDSLHDGNGIYVQTGIHRTAVRKKPWLPIVNYWPGG